jgi:hypothetical protein
MNLSPVPFCLNAPGTQTRLSCLILLLTLILGLACATTPALATESGGSAYVGGNEDFMSGALPPPGFYPIVYGVHYSADKLADNSGNETPIDFDLSINAMVFRLVHTTKLTVLGASLGWHVIVPVMDVNVKLKPAPGVNVDESSSGIGDIEFSPLILGWHLSKNLHMIGTLDFMVPTGDYDQADPSSLGRNYVTIDPVWAVTYLSDSGFELSGKFQYLINLENSDTDYTSGHEFICDYLVGQHIGPWNLGLNGYIYKQVTDDELNGNTVHDNKGQCISIGPAVQYNYKNMFFNVKLQFDTEVKNRPEGYKAWLKFMYAF